MKKPAKTCVALTGFVGLLSLSVLPAVAADKSNPHAGHDMSQMKSAGVTGDIPVNGMIHKVDKAKRSVNVTHDPIPALKWPTMTMDLPVTKRVDLSTIKPGSAVILTLKQGRDKQYRITGIKPQK